MSDDVACIDIVDIENLLCFRRDGYAFDVSEKIWKQALLNVESDSVVNIRHATISGNESYRIHVAAIPKQVGCHVHKVGNEDYSVVAGQGVLYFAPVTNKGSGCYVEESDWLRMSVSEGDSFVIPEGYAHQLRRTGVGELTILFGCPDAHLNDSKDRTMLADAPINC